MRRSPCSWALLMLTLSLPTAPVSALTVLDQDHFEGSMIYGAQSDFYLFMAQTFTVGISGDLVQVGVELVRGPTTTTPMEMQIRSVDGSGAPTGTVLATTSVEAAAVSDDFYAIGEVFFDLSSNPITAASGDRLAIVLMSPSEGVYVWVAAATSGPYGGGNAYHDQGAFGNDETFDFSFRTYMLVPEPAPVALVVVGLGGLLLRRSRAR